jgi:ribosomal protein S18 acetylase RimI-like enzyme
VIAAHVVWLLLEGNKIAGLLVLMARAGHLLLDNIAVHPDYHGQGLGG